MRKQIYYCISGLVIRIDSDLSYEIPHGNAEDFICEPQEADIVYRFEQTDRINDLVKDAIYAGENPLGFDFVSSDGTMMRAFRYLEEGYEDMRLFDAVTEVKGNRGVIHYLNEYTLLKRCMSGYNFFNYLYIDALMYNSRRLILHSSHIERNNKAILFTAPSGTGKSTQADLWKKYGNAQVINGDRTVIRHEDDIWYADGCPMCGTSGIHLNSSAKIAAVVMLEQSAGNEIVETRAGYKLNFLYSQCSVQASDQKKVSETLDIISELIKGVPVMKYRCTKERDAYEYLNRYLEERGYL